MTVAAARNSWRNDAWSECSVPRGSGDTDPFFVATLIDKRHQYRETASGDDQGTRAGGWNPGDDFGIYILEIQAGDLRIPVVYDARMAVTG